MEVNGQLMTGFSFLSELSLLNTPSAKGSSQQKLALGTHIWCDVMM